MVDLKQLSNLLKGNVVPFESQTGQSAWIYTGRWPRQRREGGIWAKTS
jgi:hypothetical protein